MTKFMLCCSAVVVIAFAAFCFASPGTVKLLDNQGSLATDVQASAGVIGETNTYSSTKTFTQEVGIGIVGASGGTLVVKSTSTTDGNPVLAIRNNAGTNIFTVSQAGNIVSGASVTASAFYGNGANLTNLPSGTEANTYTSTKTFTVEVGIGGGGLDAGTLVIKSTSTTANNPVVRVIANNGTTEIARITQAGHMGIGTKTPEAAYNHGGSWTAFEIAGPSGGNAGYLKLSTDLIGGSEGTIAFANSAVSAAEKRGAIIQALDNGGDATWPKSKLVFNVNNGGLNRALTLSGTGDVAFGGADTAKCRAHSQGTGATTGAAPAITNTFCVENDTDNIISFSAPATAAQGIHWNGSGSTPAHLFWYGESHASYPNSFTIGTASKYKLFIGGTSMIFSSGTFTLDGNVQNVLALGGTAKLWSRTKAQIDAITPGAVGEQLWCSNCDPDGAGAAGAIGATCVSSGTAISQFYDVSTPARGCGSNE